MDLNAMSKEELIKYVMSEMAQVEDKKKSNPYAWEVRIKEEFTNSKVLYATSQNVLDVLIKEGYPIPGKDKLQSVRRVLDNLSRPEVIKKHFSDLFGTIMPWTTAQLEEINAARYKANGIKKMYEKEGSKIAGFRRRGQGTMSAAENPPVFPSIPVVPQAANEETIIRDATGKVMEELIAVRGQFVIERLVQTEVQKVTNIGRISIGIIGKMMHEYAVARGFYKWRRHEAPTAHGTAYALPSVNPPDTTWFRSA